MDGPERSPHAKLSCELKSSFFSEVSRAFVPVRMLSANQIAEKSQYALSEEDKQKDEEVRQHKDGKMQKAQTNRYHLGCKIMYFNTFCMKLNYLYLFFKKINDLNYCHFIVLECLRKRFHFHKTSFTVFTSRMLELLFKVT